MRILIITPLLGDLITGNRCSAEQWRGVLESLGHQVELADRYGGQDADVLLALHAVKSREAIDAYRVARRDGKVCVVLTGTDIYPEPCAAAIDTMRIADRLVGLQRRVEDSVPSEFHPKLRVILQAAPGAAIPGAPSPDHFDVAVVANLRAVKDPLLAAEASRAVPAESRLRIRHAGGVIEAEFEGQALREAAENPRYERLGVLDFAATQDLVASCDLLVVTSLAEGAGRVVGEAIAVGTPVLSTQIDGVVGLLGTDYPGYFPVGDAKALASLLWRAESDPKFLHTLQDACRALASQFAPEAESEGWRQLMNELEQESEKR